MNKNSLISLSTEAMDRLADDWARKLRAFGQVEIIKNPESYILKDSQDRELYTIANPHFENWNIYEGLGKVLKDLIDDPGMHNTAMKYYGKKEIADLVNIRLIDCSGNPNDFGKKVYSALKEFSK